MSILSSIKKWWKARCERKAFEENYREVVRLFRDFIEKHFSHPDKYQKIIGLETRNWKAGSFVIVHERQVRGDLITIKIQNTMIAQWVDQSHQYPGFLGLNDVWLNPELKAERVAENLEKYVPDYSSK